MHFIFGKTEISKQKDKKIKEIQSYTYVHSKYDLMKLSMQMELQKEGQMSERQMYSSIFDLIKSNRWYEKSYQ